MTSRRPEREDTGQVRARRDGRPASSQAAVGAQEQETYLCQSPLRVSSLLPVAWITRQHQHQNQQLSKISQTQRHQLHPQHQAEDSDSRSALRARKQLERKTRISMSHLAAERGHNNGAKRTMKGRLSGWTGLLLLTLAAPFWSVSSLSAGELASIADARDATNSTFGNLVAIGASSLMEPNRNSSDRLVDQLGELGGARTADKLDYIIDFLQANKLTKFCDMLTSPEPEVRTLNERLNSLTQFTLFVPTNEALLLMPSQLLEQIKQSGAQVKQFLLAHATSELVVPTISMSARQTRWSQARGPLLPAQVTGASSSLIFSLAGSALRVNTVPAAPRAANGSGSTKLDLIVNGANVLSGQSYALQEPNNSSATYAIVHLIDRSLYPAPAVNLMDKVRLLAPTMARYLDMAQERPLSEALESSRSLLTYFLPNDDAFRATPAKLLDQLETNRTFLLDFLRGHLVEGLYYSGQLTGGTGDEQVRLSATSGAKLEFESKTLQSRTLVLVNTAPILEADIMALNGVIHLLSRPLFPPHVLEGCHCAVGNQSLTRQPANLTEAAIYDKLWPRGGARSGVSYESETSAGQSPYHNELAVPASNELERDESQVNPSTSQLARSQRSGLVARNNRDFYRPSAAPANLFPASQDSSQRPRSQQPQQADTVGSWQANAPAAAPEIFDADRYKVLNATNRQRQRDRLSESPSNSMPQFQYDRVLTSPVSTGVEDLPTEATVLRRPYASVVNSSLAPSANTSGWSSEDQTSGTSQRQRVLKFQPEDARDPQPGTRFQNLSRTAGSGGPASVQPSYDIFPGASDQRPMRQQQLSAKTLSPAASCAFYDSDCKRLMGRLVHLPAVRRNKSQDLAHLATGLTANHSSPRTSGEQHLDSTFGETTESSLPAGWTQPMSQPQLKTSNQPLSVVNAPRVSPLNQPLPPWSDEELYRTGVSVGVANWRAQDRDISRLPNSKQALPTGNLRTQPTRAPTAQILLVPVKMLQETVPSLTAQINNLTSQQFSNEKAIYVPATSHQTRSNKVIFGNQQYHTPTPYSVSSVTTHMPLIFASPNQLGRLTNFSSVDLLPADQPSFPPGPGQRAKSARVQIDSHTLRAPSAHRKHHLTQVQIDNNGSLGANFEVNPTSGVKQARKLVHLQQQQQQQIKSGDYFTGGDISITSAKLSAPLTQLGANLSEGLVSHASNQAPDVSTNFVRNTPPAPTDSSADFFQNRTISEIMDDSGLRIDGQQVTFGRLKECLADAELLSLITQTGNSVTIFMPTDTAFQRLVQQQAVASQRDRQVGTRAGAAARLLDPAKRHLLPLVARRPGSIRAASARQLDAGSPEATTSSDFSAANAADRLTLDCGHSQVRQVLLDHLSARLITPKELKTDMAISSLSGRQLLLSSVPSKKIVVVDGQPVIAATRAKNGMVYVVNKFLNLTQQVPNVVELIENQPNLTTFLSYLTFSSLADRLKRETGPLTILAPTNEAFEQLSSSARQLLNSDPAALMDVLRGHIVEGAQFGKLISMRNRLKTMNADQSIEAKVIKPNVYLLDNQMTSMRLVGTTGNGVVNAIDRLIVPGWLKVSMGAKPAPVEVPRNLPAPVATATTVRPSFASELDSSSARSQALNLPVIGNQPMRFEQPGNRLGAPGGSSSFLLANGNGTNINNNDIGFDTTDNSSFLATTTAQSPFLRVANSLTSGNRAGEPELVAGGRSNRTKNAQLIEKLANLMQAKKFVKYLFRSKVAESLKPDMNYVILVPTDQAVEKLPKQIIDMLDRDADRLADLVNYHVLDTTFEYINTIPDGQTLNTLNEKDIVFNWHRNNTVLTASGAVVLGGIQEDNIALLIVDRVLYPTPGDILNIISKSPILSNFTSLVRNAGLEQQLSLAGPYTLFAPSDYAFNQLARGELDFLRRNRESARRFLLRHLSQPAVFTSSIALSNSSSVTDTANSRDALLTSANTGRAGSLQQVPSLVVSNSLGEDLTLRQRNDYFSVNEVNFSYADVAATNGVVHVIDGLL